MSVDNHLYIKTKTQYVPCLYIFQVQTTKNLDGQTEIVIWNCTGFFNQIIFLIVIQCCHGLSKYLSTIKPYTDKPVTIEKHVYLALMLFKRILFFLQS